MPSFKESDEFIERGKSQIHYKNNVFGGYYYILKIFMIKFYD